VLKKHPLEVQAAFEIPGMVASLHVSEGDSVGETQILAKLRDVEIEEKFEDVQEVYLSARDAYAAADEALRKAVKSDVAGDGMEELKQRRMEAKTTMDSALQQVNELRAKLDAASLSSPGSGVVQDVRVMVHDHVEAGDVIMVIDPQDHFYTFNKSLAILSFIAFWIFLGIHILTN
jgi:multidrug resistance efflux pump